MQKRLFKFREQSDMTKATRYWIAFDSSAAQRHLNGGLAIGECPTLEKLEEVEAKIREDLEWVMKETREKIGS